MDIILDYPGGPSVITKFLKNEKFQTKESQNYGNMRIGPNIDGFEDGEVAMSKEKPGGQLERARKQILLKKFQEECKKPC